MYIEFNLQVYWIQIKSIWIQIKSKTLIWIQYIRVAKGDSIQPVATLLWGNENVPRRIPKNTKHDKELGVQDFRPCPHWEPFFGAMDPQNTKHA